MRDPDEVMAYEAEQHEVAESIIRKLHRSIEDHYLEKFSNIAVMCLAALAVTDCLEELDLCDTKVGAMICPPIREFAKNEIERKLLLSQVARKLVDPVLGQHYSNYLRNEIAASASSS